MKRFHRRKKLPQKATRRARAAAEVAQQGVEGGGRGGVGGRLFAMCRRLGGLFIFTTENWYSARFRGKGPKGRPYRTGFRFFRKLGVMKLVFSLVSGPIREVFFLFLVPFFCCCCRRRSTSTVTQRQVLQRDDGLIALQRASAASCIPPI